jgi:hypothetical protein
MRTGSCLANFKLLVYLDCAGDEPNELPKPAKPSFDPLRAIVEGAPELVLPKSPLLLDTTLPNTLGVLFVAITRAPNDDPCLFASFVPFLPKRPELLGPENGEGFSFEVAEKPNGENVAFVAVDAEGVGL